MNDDVRYELYLHDISPDVTAAVGGLGLHVHPPTGATVASWQPSQFSTSVVLDDARTPGGQTQTRSNALSRHVRRLWTHLQHVRGGQAGPAAADLLRALAPLHDLPAPPRVVVRAEIGGFRHYDVIVRLGDLHDLWPPQEQSGGMSGGRLQWAELGLRRGQLQTVLWRGTGQYSRPVSASVVGRGPLRRLLGREVDTLVTTTGPAVVELAVQALHASLRSTTAEVVHLADVRGQSGGGRPSPDSPSTA